MPGSTEQGLPARVRKAGNPVPVLAAECAVMDCVCMGAGGAFIPPHSAMAAFITLQRMQDISRELWGTSQASQVSVETHRLQADAAGV